MELSEAILSMFRWYRQSQKCYVFLADVTALKRGPVSWGDGFRNSKWVHRGWTLLEVIAPPIVEFFTRDRSFLGTKLTLEQQIHQVTSIPVSVLRGDALSEFSPNARLRWAQNRQMKTPEDRVYSLLGIFDVIVPIQYGAGYKSAFQKLEDEITRRWTQLDRSIMNPDHASRPTANPSEGAERRDRHRKQLLDSLRFDQMDDREKTTRNPQRDTCEWLFALPLFTRWNDVDQRRDHDPILWISGKPGAGKSTLMKTIHTRAVQRKGNNDMICHFFFNASLLAGGCARKKMKQLLNAPSSQNSRIPCVLHNSRLQQCTLQKIWQE